MSKRGRPMAPWMQRSLTGVIRAGLAGMATLDLAGNLHFASDMGRRFGAMPFNRDRLQRAQGNLAVAFPGASEAWTREHALSSYSHLFSLGVEMAYAPRLLSEDAWSERVELGNLQSAARHLCQRKPLILVTGHCGNWEVLGFTLAMLGFTIHALYRPLDLKPMDAWVRRTRQERGLELVDKFGAVEALPRLLSEGRPVAFVADQNAGERGLFVPFFNRLASAYKTIGLLAMQHEATIVCGQARRLVPGRDRAPNPATPDKPGYAGDPFRYRIEVADIITPDMWQDQPDALFYITARYRHAIETMVRRAPEQYLWMHRYWKSRPRHERLNRPFPEPLREKIASLPWIDEAQVERLVERSAVDAARMISDGKGAKA